MTTTMMTMTRTQTTLEPRAAVIVSGLLFPYHEDYREIP